MKIKIYTLFFILALVFIAACTSQQKTTTNSIYTPNEEDTQINNPPVDNTPSSNVPVPGNEDVEEMIVDNIIEDAEVEIEDFKYNPSTITIQKGATVTFKQRDSTKHTVTSDDNLFNSGLLSKDEEWSYTFNQEGTYEYHCTPHPNMKGKIIVE